MRACFDTSLLVDPWRWWNATINKRGFSDSKKDDHNLLEHKWHCAPSYSSTKCSYEFYNIYWRNLVVYRNCDFRPTVKTHNFSSIWLFNIKKSIDWNVSELKLIIYIYNIQIWIKFERWIYIHGNIKKRLTFERYK